MKTNAKVSIGIVAALSAIAAAAIWWVYRNRNEIQAENAKTPTYHHDGYTYGSNSDLFPLKQGSRGEAVRLLQRALNVIPPNVYALIAEDGIFGPKTEESLASFLEKLF